MLTISKKNLGLILIVAAIIVLVPIVYALFVGNTTIKVFTTLAMLPISYGSWLIWQKFKQLNY